MTYDCIIFSNESSKQIIPGRLLEKQKCINWIGVSLVNETIWNRSSDKYETDLQGQEETIIRARENSFAKVDNSTIHELGSTFPAV